MVVLWRPDIPRDDDLVFASLTVVRWAALLVLAALAWVLARSSPLPRRANQATRQLAAATLPATLCPDCLRVARGLPHSCWRCESTHLLQVEDEPTRQQTLATLRGIAEHLRR